MSDLDLLGPPRSCKQLPGWLWVSLLGAPVVLVCVAAVAKALL